MYIIGNTLKSITPKDIINKPKKGTIIVPDGVKRIGNYCFYELDYVYNVILPDNVTSIGKFAFESCKNLRTVKMSKNIKRIEDCAFCFCTKLNKMELPDTITSLGSESLNDVNLKKVKIPSKIKNLLYGTLLQSYVEEVTLPEGLKSIDGEAFYYCEYLDNVYIPDSVESIGCGAFSDCSALTRIHIPKSLKYFEPRIFVDSKLEENNDMNIGCYKLLYIDKKDHKLYDRLYKWTTNTNNKKIKVRRTEFIVGKALLNNNVEKNIKKYNDREFRYVKNIFSVFDIGFDNFKEYGIDFVVGKMLVNGENHPNEYSNEFVAEKITLERILSREELIELLNYYDTEWNLRKRNFDLIFDVNEMHRSTEEDQKLLSEVLEDRYKNRNIK